MSSDIDKMKNAGEVVVVGDREVAVKEVLMRDLGQFWTVCEPFFHAFDEVAELTDKRGQEQSQFALFKILARHSTDFIVAASLVSDADVEFLGSLKPDEFFEVAAAVVRVNGSFFVHALAPALINFARSVGQTGLMLSIDSLATDIALSQPSATH